MTRELKKAQPKFDCTVFLDRTHGKTLGTLLRRVGFDVRTIFTVYPKRKHESTGDPTWIKKCGEEGWIALSGDKRLETNVENKYAIIKAKCKVFLFTDSNSLPEEWAAAVIVGRQKILDLVRQNEGPFFATIGKQSNSHVARLRVPKMKEEKIIAVPEGV